MLKRMWLKLPLVVWGVKKEKVAVDELTFFAQSILVGNKVQQWTQIPKESKLTHKTWHSVLSYNSNITPVYCKCPKCLSVIKGIWCLTTQWEGYTDSHLFA